MTGWKLSGLFFAIALAAGLSACTSAPAQDASATREAVSAADAAQGESGFADIDMVPPENLVSLNGMEEIAVGEEGADSAAPSASAAAAAQQPDEDGTTNVVAVFEVPTPYCVVPGGKYCRYSRPGIEGYPCKCGATAGRFAVGK